MIQVFRKTVVWDLLFLAILTAVSLFLISFYFNAQYLNTGYPDWMVHAFRVKFIQQYGFASWTHFWSNGISVLKAYQFVPHYITLAVANGLHVEITRAMVLLTIGQFVLLRILIYTMMRLLKFSPITCFVCSLLSFDLAQYWGGVGDYTLMFASTSFPVMIFLWVRYYEGKILYLFPYIVGICFYIHPMLGINSAILMILAVIFSDRPILTLSHLLQIIIFLISSSIFWFPIVFKGSFNYSSEIFANRSFLNLVLSHYDYFGLSLFILACLGLSIIRSFMPILARYKWSTVLVAYAVSMFVLIIIGLNLPLPRAIAQLQYTRSITLVGLAIIVSFGLVVESIRKIRISALKGALLFIFSLSLVEGMWFISVYSPQPVRMMYEAISSYTNNNGIHAMDQGRIWTSDIGNASYFAPLTLRLPHSYMGHMESNQVPLRLPPLINFHPYIDEIPKANLDRIDDYYKLSGTKYALFEETSAFTKSYLDANKSDYKDAGTIELPNAIYHMFETPWQIRNSVVVDKKYKQGLSHFPFNLLFSNVNDQIELDDYVHRFVDVLYKPENTPLKVTYPTQESVQIEVPAKRTSKLVYLNESYDANWKAYFNDRLQKIEPSGPNYMLITLDSLEKGTLVLRHTWPLSFYVSVFLIILIPCEMLLMKGISLLFAKERRVSSRT